MLDLLHYEIVEKSIETLFPNIKSDFDYENISTTNPRYIHQIKDFCEVCEKCNHVHNEDVNLETQEREYCHHKGCCCKSYVSWRPLFEDIKNVFKQTILIKNISIKKTPITFDYNFTKNIDEDHIDKIKNILQQNKFHTFETHPNVFLLAKHEEYEKNILIFVSDQKYKKKLEIHDLQNILNIWKWFCENDYGQSPLAQSLSICGWSSKDVPQIRQNALKRRIVIDDPSRVIRALQWCGNLPNIDSSITKRDVVWIKQNEENFIELKKLILFNAKEIIFNENLFSKTTPLTDEAMIDLVFVLNISKN